MHPTLLKIGPFAARSYGFMLALGFFAGIMLSAWRAKKSGENPDHIYNLAVWVVLSSILGARIYYIITHYSEFMAVEYHSLVQRFFIEMKNMFWPVGDGGQVGISGLVLYGGLIGATLVTWLYLRIHKLNVLIYMDFIAPALGLGQFFTRIGCFLNGCCFGRPTESVFGILFPQDSAAGMYFPGMSIHPAQLYSSLAGLAICAALLLLERYKRFHGYSAMLYFIFYAISRFFIDFTRYYEPHVRLFGFSHNQLVSIAVLVIAVPLFVYFSRRARSATPDSMAP